MPDTPPVEAPGNRAHGEGLPHAGGGPPPKTCAAPEATQLAVVTARRCQRRWGRPTGLYADCLATSSRRGSLKTLAGG